LVIAMKSLCKGSPNHSSMP